MTLTEAFSVVTATAVDPSEAVREEAMVRVYEELRRLAGLLRVDRDIQEESASRGFQRLVLGGPRVVEQHDAVTQHYLRRIVRSISLDLLRSRGREIPIDLDEAGHAASDSRLDNGDPETGLVVEERERDQAEQKLWVFGFVFTEVAKMVSDSIAPRYRADFIESMSQFEEVVSGQSSLDDLVQRTFGTVTPATRDRLYQRHSRARRRLYEWVEQELPSLEPLRPSQKQLVRNLVAQFRR